MYISWNPGYLLTCLMLTRCGTCEVVWPRACLLICLLQALATTLQRRKHEFLLGQLRLRDANLKEGDNEQPVTQDKLDAKAYERGTWELRAVSTGVPW